MKVTIIILNYNTVDLLKQCLQHLESLALPFSTQVVIVDNGSTDGSQDWLRNLSSPLVTTILSEQNLGFAAGCNLGIQEATGEYILLLNTDAFPTPGALDYLVDYLDQHPDVGIAGPQLLYPDGSWQHSGAVLPSPTRALFDAVGLTGIILRLLMMTGRWRKASSIGFVAGACMLIRHDMLRQIGALDESYFFYVEDMEYCQRAHQHGWKVRLVHKSQVIHLHGGSSSQVNLEKSLRQEISAIRQLISAKHGPRGWQQYYKLKIFQFRLKLVLGVLFRQSPDLLHKYDLIIKTYKAQS